MVTSPPTTGFASRARAFALGLKESLNGCEIERHPAFANKYLGQIDRETVGIVQFKRGLCGKFTFPLFCQRLFKQSQATIKSAIEQGLLTLQYPSGLRFLLSEFRENVSKRLDHDRNELA